MGQHLVECNDFWPSLCLKSRNRKNVDSNEGQGAYKVFHSPGSDDGKAPMKSISMKLVSRLGTRFGSGRVCSGEARKLSFSTI